MLKPVGKAAWWAANTAKAAASGVGSGTAMPYLLGGAAAIGVGSAILDKEGPYSDIQEAVVGEPHALQYAIQAAVRTGFSRDERYNIDGPMDYYYGRPVDVRGMNEQRSSGSSSPVSGDVVFGMYNLRR